MCHKRGHTGDASDDTLAIVLTLRVSPGPGAGHNNVTRMALLFLSARISEQFPGMS